MGGYTLPMTVEPSEQYLTAIHVQLVLPPKNNNNKPTARLCQTSVHTTAATDSISDRHFSQREHWSMDGETVDVASYHPPAAGSPSHCRHGHHPFHTVARCAMSQCTWTCWQVRQTLNESALARLATGGLPDVQLLEAPWPGGAVARGPVRGGWFAALAVAVAWQRSCSAQ